MNITLRYVKKQGQEKAINKFKLNMMMNKKSQHNNRKNLKNKII